MEIGQVYKSGYWSSSFFTKWAHELVFAVMREETHLGKSARSIPPHLKLYSPHGYSRRRGQPRRAFLNHVPLHLWPLLIRWGVKSLLFGQTMTAWCSLLGNIGLGLRLEDGHINGKVLPTLAAVSTTASKGPLLDKNPEATGKQRKPVCRKRQMDRPSLQEKTDRRPPGPWDTNPVTSAFQCQERHHKKWTESCRIKLPGFKSQPWHLPVWQLNTLLLNCSLLPHLKPGGHNRTYVTGLLWKSNELIQE